MPCVSGWGSRGKRKPSLSPRWLRQDVTHLQVFVASMSAELPQAMSSVKLFSVVARSGKLSGFSNTGHVRGYSLVSVQIAISRGVRS